jgi:bacterioferritin
VRNSFSGERKHAEPVIERIPFLEGAPNIRRCNKVHIGGTLPDQFKTDRALELEAVRASNAGIAASRDAGNNNSHMLLESILQAEAEHADWLESRTGLIHQAGLQNDLASQMRKEEP